MKLTWNFLGERGCKTKNLLWGGVWIFSGTTQCTSNCFHLMLITCSFYFEHLAGTGDMTFKNYMHAYQLAGNVHVAYMCTSCYLSVIGTG